MAYPNGRFGYRQAPSDAEVNRKPPGYFNEDDSNILESALLDSDIMQNADAAHVGKSSYAHAHGMLSPNEPHVWPPQYAGPVRMEPASVGNATPYHDHHYSFNREHAPQPAPFGHPAHPHGWAYDQRSGNCTPTSRMDFEQQPPAASFEVPQYHHQRTDSARGSFSHPHQHLALHRPDESFIPAPPVQTPMSPHSHQDWMNLAAQEVEHRPMSRRMRGQSPPQTTIDLQRRDGIRKKNARIDIPHERSIQTIEQLLETTTDEEILKELKQQKRLLRNREAALASRQRKKRHTEDLEQQQKDFGKSLESLQAQNEALQLERQSQDQNYQILSHRFQEAQRIIDSMHDEKRDLIMKHTEETSSLRKRIRVLTDQLDHGPTPALSAEPSSGGFADFNAEMEALNMGPHDWDSLIFVNDLGSDSLDDITFDTKSNQVRHSPLLDRSDTSALTLPASAKRPPEGAAEQNVTSGLLFFLLLYGTFMVSKTSSPQPGDLPNVPPDVRKAAPTVLSNLLADSQHSTTPMHSRTPRLEGSEPAPSGVSRTSTRPHSRLDRIHQRLTAPTRQQEIDSAFSLTTAEYASLTNMDSVPNHERHLPDHYESRSLRPRRVLGESLSHTPDEHSQNSKAEVYTRSLLWDQIPADVIKQFREMVRDHDEIEARQRQERQNNEDMNAYKLET